MIKKFLCTIVLLTSVYALGYAQKGSYSEDRSVGSFKAISACCGIDVFISEGNSSTIKVEISDREYLPNLITETKNGVLKISFDNKGFFSRRPNNLKMKVYVTASNLESISSSSGSDIRSQGMLTAQDIELSSTSGADLSLELNAVNIKGSVSSGSDMKLKGRASYASLSANSGADMDLGDMVINVVKASASSGSDIVVTVLDEIDAKASSGGDVIYKGNPKTVNAKKNSGGGVKHRK